MVISELIKHLQGIHDIEGDIECFLEEKGDGSLTDIELNHDHVTLERGILLSLADNDFSIPDDTPILHIGS